MVLSRFLLLAALLSLPAAFATNSCEEALPQYLADFAAGRPTNPLPIPPSSRAPQVRDVGYNLGELRPGVYYVHDGAYFALILLRGRTLVLVDFPENQFVKRDESGNPIGTRIEDAVLELLKGVEPQRIDMIYSHSHFDHVGTATFTRDFLRRRFPRAKLRIIASKGTYKTLLRTESGRAPLPTHLFRSRAVLRYGDRRSGLRVFLKVVGGHTEDDVLVYIPPSGGEQGVAFLVDVVFPGWAPFFYFALSQSLDQYIDVHDRILALDFGTFIGGHLTRLGTRRDVEISKEFTLSVVEEARKAQRSTADFGQIGGELGVFDPASPNVSNFWLAFSELIRRNQRACAAGVVAKWGCRLAGIDVLADTHCFVAYQYLQIDL